MTSDDDKGREEALAPMTPEERRSFKAWAAALKPWLTLKGLIIAWLALAAFIGASAVLPDLNYILSSEFTRAEFVGRIPFVLMVALGGSFAALALGAVVAFVGGHIVLYLRRSRHRRG